MKQINTKEMMGIEECIRRNEKDRIYSKEIADENIERCEEKLKTLSAPLDAAINEAEGRATARTISARLIIRKLYDITEKLGISKKAMNGVKITVDLHAQHFPNAYQYTPESTIFSAEYKNGSWRITGIFRGSCRAESKGVIIELTEEAKAAIIAKYESF